MSSWVIETHNIYVAYNRSYHISYYWEKCEGYCVRVVLNDEFKAEFEKTYATREEAEKSFNRQIRKIRKELEEHDKEVQKELEEMRLCSLKQ